MRLTVLFLALIACTALAGNWTTVGGNNEHNGLSDELGPRTGELAWSAWTPPATISMQAFTWYSLVVTMRYSFSPMAGTLVCHNLVTGDTVWTRLYRPGGKFVPIGVSEGRVFCRNFRETGNDSLFCVDASDGSILWQSRWTVPVGIVWCGVFCPNGDVVIPGAEHPVMRIAATTGDTVWTLDRPTPNTGAEWMGEHGGILYTWTGYINTPKRLLAVDLNSGVILDSTAALPGDGDQEQPLVISPDGVVYAQRDGGLLYALRYTDSGFVTLWTRNGGGSVWMNYGVGPDSTVYVPIGRRMFRLDPATGAAKDSSPELVTGDALVPRTSIDREGYVYVMATTGTGEGKLWALTPSLDTLWHHDYGYTYYSGPAIGFGGTTVVPAAGTLIDAYRPTTAIGTGTDVVTGTALSARPNPFRTSTTITLPGGATASIFNTQGQLVGTVVPNGGRATWDGRDDSGTRLPAGAYVCRVRSGTTTGRLRLILTN